MKAAMTSLSFITSALITWNCGQASNTQQLASKQYDKTDSSQVAFDWGLLPEEDTLKLVTGWYYVVESGNGVKRILEGDTLVYWLNPAQIVTAKDIASFDLYESNFDRSWGLTMRLNESVVDQWREATGQSVGGRLAFIVHNRLLYAPQVMAEIPSGITVLNRGTYGKGELKAIMTAIQSEQR